MVYTVIMVEFGHIVTYFKMTATKGDKFAIDENSQTPQNAIDCATNGNLAQGRNSTKNPQCDRTREPLLNKTIQRRLFLA
ncbi:MAG: hypothetical protein VKK42_10500 [Lyngbya sp.]|nr:hypothetical protein [Lyngbya sp.]